jgi:5-deoxy-glucuronate isomerase
MSALRHLPHGSLADAGDPVALEPEQAGWSYTGLRVLGLEAGIPRTVTTGRSEAVILPLSAERLTVTVDGESFAVAGRSSVFARVTDFVYAPRDARVTITSETGGEVALAASRCERRLTPRYGPSDSVAVEIRGAGPATRQVTNFCSPETWPHADKLMCVELITPDGNWSSYPPHRHDDSPECPVNNEEIYYFRIGRAGALGYSTEGFGLHRTYTPDGQIDDHVTIRDGDVYLVPRGYHGPCIAAPGYPMYYLNILAGPSGERSMAFCDDPAHHWVRESWAAMETDPRCPVTSHEGVVNP